MFQPIRKCPVAAILDLGAEQDQGSAFSGPLIEHS